MKRLKRDFTKAWWPLALLASAFIAFPTVAPSGRTLSQPATQSALQHPEKPQIALEVTATGNFANLETFELEEGITVPLLVVPLTEEGTFPESTEELPFSLSPEQPQGELKYALLPDEKYLLNLKVTSSENIEWVKVYEEEKLLATFRPDPKDPKKAETTGIEWGGGSPWFEIKVAKFPAVRWIGFSFKVLAVYGKGVAYPKTVRYFYEPLNLVIAHTCKVSEKGKVKCCQAVEWRVPLKETRKVKVLEMLERPKVEIKPKVRKLLSRFKVSLEPSMFQPGPSKMVILPGPAKDEDTEVEVVVTPTSPPSAEPRKIWSWWIGAAGTEWVAKCELMVLVKVKIDPWVGSKVTFDVYKSFDAGRWRWITRQIIGSGWIPHECECPHPPCEMIPSEPPKPPEEPSPPSPPSQPPQPKEGANPAFPSGGSKGNCGCCF